MTATEYVILVDTDDHEVGTAEKMAAHQAGLLHRAFSIFTVKKTANGLEILLQQRALSKYHSAGRWTNTCCSHPRPGESLLAAATRRLNEEMGILAELQPIGQFIYQAQLDNHLSEHELDHVLIHWADDHLTPMPNPDEVASIRWIHLTELERLIEKEPAQFTVWLKPALTILKEHLSRV